VVVPPIEVLVLGLGGSFTVLLRDLRAAVLEMLFLLIYLKPFLPFKELS